MPYTLNRTDGSTLVTLADGVVDNTTDIQLVGRNVAGYGEIQNENFVKLLENFASVTTPPSRPQVGQIWFDKEVNAMRPSVFDGVQWRNLGIVQIAPANQVPQNRKEGDLWWDQTNNQLYGWTADGNKHVLIGPEDLIDYSFTKWRSIILTDTSAVDHPVIAGYVNNVVYCIVADAEFEIDQNVTPMPDFTKCYNGTTLKGTSATGVSTSTKHHGTATDADRLVGKAGDTYANRLENETIAGVYSFQNNDGINVGPNNELKINVDNVSGNAGINNETNDVLSFGVNYTGSGADKTVFFIEGKDIKPYANNEVNLGAPTVKYRNIYADAIFSNVIGDATGTFSGNLTGNTSGTHTGATNGSHTGPTVGQVKATGGKIIVNNDLQTSLADAGRDGVAGNYEGYFDGVAKFVIDGMYRTHPQTITSTKTWNATQTFNQAVNINNTASAYNVNLSKGTIGAGAIPSQDAGRTKTDLTIDGVTIDNSEIEDTNLNRVVIDDGSRIENSALGTVGILSEVKSTVFTDRNNKQFKFISDDGAFNNVDNDTVVTALAIKQYVDNQVASVPKDISFHLDTKDMNTDDVKAQLQRIAPASGYANGTKARILGSHYFANNGTDINGNKLFFYKYGARRGTRYGIGFIGGRSYTFTGSYGGATDLINSKSGITGYEFVVKGAGNPTDTTSTPNISPTLDLTFAGFTGWLVLSYGLTQDQADYIGIPAGASSRILVMNNGVVIGTSPQSGAITTIDGIRTGQTIGRQAFAQDHQLAWTNLGGVFSGNATMTASKYAFDFTQKEFGGSWNFVGNF